MQNFEKTKIKQVILESFRLSARKEIPYHMIKNMKVDIIDDMINNVIFDFSTFLAQENKKETKTTTSNEVNNHIIPATIWQAIKDKYAPKWFIKLFPVVNTKLPCITKTINNITNNYTNFYTDIDPLTTHEVNIMEFK